MITQKHYQDFFSLCKSAKNILILNSKADGDSIGASLALQLMLKKLGKEVTSYSTYQIPDYLNFLTTKAPIKVVDLSREPIANFDFIITVDTSEISRTTNQQTISFLPSTKFACIDHHPIQSQILGLSLIDTQTESTCGIITDLAIEYKSIECIELFDENISFLLFAGIVSDTDYFGYAQVNKDTFERAAYLMQYNFDKTPIIVQFRESLGIESFRFIQKHIQKITINNQKKYAYLILKKEDISPEDHILIVNEACNFLNRAIMRIITGIDFAFILREINSQKCSLALRKHNNGNTINLSKIASQFGGGGHPQAAGAVLDIPIEQAEQKIITYLNNI